MRFDYPGMVPRSALSLHLKESDKQQLLQWSSAFGTPQQVALRCRIALAAAEGESADQIAARLEINRKTVMLWRARFEQEGLEGLWEVASGRGRKPTYGAEKIQSIVDALNGAGECPSTGASAARTSWVMDEMLKR